MPRVSVVLPNFNHRPFLEERLATIYAQTLTDWELVAFDFGSNDGAWELLQHHARREPRIRLQRAEGRGLYSNWNHAIAAARGDYVYLATSDDTMAPDCLAELAAALDTHSRCDIAQCCLHAIDERGETLPGWWRLVGAYRFLGDTYLRPHLRLAPYDGVVHSAMHTVYHSITQILIRRSALGKIGAFPTAYGPGGDFYWGMRAGLLCDVVHVPKFLTTWRMHSTQASNGYRVTAAERALMAQMVDDVLASSPAGSAASRLPARPLRFAYRYEHHRLAYAATSTPGGKLRALVSLLAEPAVALGTARLIAAGQRRSFDKRAYTQRLLQRLDLENHVVSLPGPTTPAPA